MTYWADPFVDLYQGDCREVLANLPAESVDCVVTSPPYWGLRKYAGEQNLIWGGDAECPHTQTEDSPLPGVPKPGNKQRDYIEPGLGYTGRHRWQHNGSSAWVEQTPERKRGADFGPNATAGNTKSIRAPTEVPHGAFCSTCGAWRGAFGLEPTIEMYIAHSVEILCQIKRVLKKTGVVWWNIGDSYAGSNSGKGDYRAEKGLQKDIYNFSHPQAAVSFSGLKAKDLCLIPFRLAIALQEDGWWVRSVIIWAKENPMPESVYGSYFTRHYVTIEEYEKLSGMRVIKGGNQNGASDLSRMSQIEISDSQKTLPAKPEGSSDNEGKGRKTRGQREAPSSQSFNSGQKEQEEIRGNGEGQDYQAKSDREIPSQPASQNLGSTTASKNEEQVRTDTAKKRSQSALFTDAEGGSKETQGLRQAQRGDSSRPDSNGGGLVGNSESPQKSLPLLPQAEGSDDRPCDTNQQGRQACQGEYSASLPKLQCQEEGQPNSTLVECPGCPKCSPHGGYILKQGAGRPTEAHEYILMLTKSERYYFDQEAVRQPLAASSWGRYTHAVNTQEKYDPKRHKTDSNHIAQSPMEVLTRSAQNVLDNGGANIRSVWEFSTQSFAGAHFATFPEELPKRCILASTSEKGNCPQCGKPWVRIIAHQPMVIRQTGRMIRAGTRSEISGTMLEPAKSITFGWQPQCSCGTEPIPAVVLDPFVGSGTTCAVAKSLGRKSVGIDISEDYLKLAQKRVAEVSLPMRL